MLIHLRSNLSPKRVVFILRKSNIDAPKVSEALKRDIQSWSSERKHPPSRRAMASNTVLKARGCRKVGCASQRPGFAG